MARASRRSVPLNIMCSMKWEIPSHSPGSSRAPFLSQAPTETERRSGMASVITVSPEGNTVRR